MAQHATPNDTPGTVLFPGFGAVPAMVADEVAGLTDAQLDWTSDQWVWSQWSIRRQVAHIGSFIASWLLDRWGTHLFPDGLDSLGDLAAVVPTPEAEWHRTGEPWPLPVLLERVDLSVRLAEHVLSGQTAGSLRAVEVERPNTPPHWRQFVNAHPTGVRWHPTEPNTTYIDLEATFRHVYYECITHLYNLQRLKRAQGLPTPVDLPREGYWQLPDWDRSEP